MALAPLSQTLLLTEDGSVAPLTQQVTIPPSIPVLPSHDITNTDEGSDLDTDKVSGATEAFASLNALLLPLQERVSAHTSALTSNNARLDALEN